MAESYKGGMKMRSGDDEMIKQALKAELEQLKASDELMAETLRRCSLEISKAEKPKSFFVELMKKPVMRYGATVAAACLLVLVFIVNLPGLFSPSRDESLNGAPGGSVAMDSADKLKNAPAAGRAPTAKGADQYSAAAAPSMDTGPAPAPTPAPEAVDAEMGIMITGAMRTASLNSLNSGNGLADFREVESDQAVGELVVSYNSALGTSYTYDEKNIITVFSLPVEGVNAETLKGTSRFGELLGGGSYSMLPLTDQSGDYAALLPVLVVPYDKSTTVTENSYVLSDDSLITYPVPGLPIGKDVIDAMLDRTRFENALKDAFGSSSITELVIVDINYGNDFLALITADGSEYAVPLFTSFNVNSLQNGQAYDIRHVLDSLARYLETGE